MLAWTVCIGCLVRACSRETSPMGCCGAGGLEKGRGHQHASGVRLITVPPIQACWQHAWCLASVESCTLGREASIIGGEVVHTHAMAKQLPLSQDVLWTRRFPVDCSIFLSGLLRRLQLAMIHRRVSMPKVKSLKRSNSGLSLPGRQAVKSVCTGL
jgi:hypothetical protein